MKWLNQLIGYGLNIIGLDVDDTIGGMAHFFIYDTIKIFVLLSVLIFMISYIQSFFTPEKSKKIIGRFNGIGTNMVEALLATFVATVTVGIILVGYLFNDFSYLFI